MRTEANGARALAADPGSGAVQFLSRWYPRGDDAGVRMTLGYRRCTDFDDGDHRGQDCAVGRSDGRYAVGVVTDGVSQSFFGDVAARVLAEGLLELLWRRAADPPDAAAVAAALHALRAQGRRQVETLRIPDHVPPMARLALEQIRGSHGSQAVFAAFVLDALAGRAHVYTVGDATAVVHGGEPGRPGEPAPADPAGRWATHGSPALGLHASVYEEVRGVVVRSDGAPGWGDEISGGTEERFRSQAPAWAAHDDVAFVAALAGDNAAAARPAALRSAASVPRLPEPSPGALNPGVGGDHRPLVDADAPRRRRPPGPSAWAPATRTLAWVAATIGVVFLTGRALRGDRDDVQPPPRPAEEVAPRSGPPPDPPGEPAAPPEIRSPVVLPRPTSPSVAPEKPKPVGSTSEPGVAGTTTTNRPDRATVPTPTPPAKKPDPRQTAGPAPARVGRPRTNPPAPRAAPGADGKQPEPAAGATGGAPASEGASTVTPNRDPRPSVEPVTTTQRQEVRPPTPVTPASRGHGRRRR